MGIIILFWLSLFSPCKTNKKEKKRCGCERKNKNNPTLFVVGWISTAALT